MGDFMKSTVVLKEGMCFDVDLGGHHFLIDADESVGGENRGPRPKPLLLSALAGCTAMDVISILRKMKHEPESFSVEAGGRLSAEHPKTYETLHIRYRFTGSGLQKEKLEKAVNLSMEKYCGVSAMLRKAAALTHEIIIE
jgi:putative redox protein